MVDSLVFLIYLQLRFVKLQTQHSQIIWTPKLIPLIDFFKNGSLDNSGGKLRRSIEYSHVNYVSTREEIKLTKDPSLSIDSLMIH